MQLKFIMKRFTLFNRKERKNTKEEEATPLMVDAQPQPKFQRKQRLVVEEETVTVAEVTEAVSKSIFKKDIIEREEKDLFDKKKRYENSLLSEYSDDMSLEEAQETVVGLSKELADAFGITTNENSGESIYEMENEECEIEKEDIPDVMSSIAADMNKEYAEFSDNSPPPLTDEFKQDIDQVLNLTKEQGNMIRKLKEMGNFYFETVSCRDGYCEIKSLDDAPNVLKVDDGFLLGNYKVFIDGVYQTWDAQFELKIRPNALVEITTGVHIQLPKDIKINVVGVEELESKYSMQVVGTQSEDEITMTLRAGNGAYLSKAGRVIKCQLSQQGW